MKGELRIHSCTNSIVLRSGAGRDKTGEALKTLGTATNVETLVDCRLLSTITKPQGSLQYLKSLSRKQYLAHSYEARRKALGMLVE